MSENVPELLNRTVHTRHKFSNKFGNLLRNLFGNVASVKAP